MFGVKKQAIKLSRRKSSPENTEGIFQLEISTVFVFFPFNFYVHVTPNVKGFQAAYFFQCFSEDAYLVVGRR